MPETPTFSDAAVAAPHAVAAACGRDVLAAGGNALEAAIAMAAALAVALPHLNGLGGDASWLVRESSGRVRAIVAAGPAGTLARADLYRQRGHETVPPRGPDAAATVAGAVGAWALALDFARSIGGRLPLADLLAPARRLAAEGCPVADAEARCRPADSEALHAAPGFAAAFLEKGSPLPAGALRKAPLLAATLDHLASAGLDDFYRGDVGREIAADLARMGAPIARADLASFRANLAEPLALPLPGVTLHAAPGGRTEWLAMLGMLERFGSSRPPSAEWHHALIEAARRAVADRAEAFPETLLDPARLAAQAAAIRRDRASPPAPPPGRCVGVWLGALDRDGWAVSCVQGMRRAYGSGCVLPATGILWHDQGAAFGLDPSCSERLEPGRRPPGATSPAFAAFDDGRVLALGIGGGGAEVVAQALARFCHGIAPAEAVNAPRWLLDAAGLVAEPGFDPSLIAELGRRGHEIEERDDRDAFGHAGMIARGARRVEAAHDPRCDGLALGL